MGSLPNLHELGKEHLVQATHTKIGPAISNPYQQHAVGHSILTQDERNKLLHRHSTHCKTKRSTQDGRRYHQGHIQGYTQGQGQGNCDDLVLEHMATYSPISSRSARNYNSTRRRDSMNSSIGANSVRRLIAVVRHTSSRTGPTFSRAVLIRNLVLLCITHILITASFLPFLALQGAVTTWIKPIASSEFPINIGSLLLALLHIFAAITSILGPIIIQKIGTNWTFVLSYFAFFSFYLIHLYPILPILLLGYVIMGLFLGPLCVARVTFLMTLSTKLNYIFGEEDEDVKAGRRICIIRRVARSFQAAQDVGLIFGSLLAALVINLTLNLKFDYLFITSKSPHVNFIDRGNFTERNSTFNQFLDELFVQDEFGDRICGSQTCPPDGGVIRAGRSVLPDVTMLLLIAVNATMALVAVVIALFLNKIKLYVYQDRSETMAAFRAIGQGFKDPVLRISAVLAFFIGVEQAFMYTDFSKFYVVCTLGLHRLNLVFLSMGLLQSIAACTLSMLLRTIQRYYVIFVGFAFHACLLMVQLLWKPIGDDPALFYVISAAWGVCNAVWEMMNFTLLTSIYTENWEAPFAHCITFRFLGIAMAFAFHGYLCTWLKLYLMAALLLCAVIPSAILERKLENMRRIRGASRL